MSLLYRKLPADMSPLEYQESLQNPSNYSEQAIERSNSDLVILQGNSITDDNNTFNDEDTNPSEPPAVIQSLLQEEQRDTNASNRVRKKRDIYICNIKTCPHYGISFGNLTMFLQHHNDNHRFNQRLSAARTASLSIYCCNKCDKRYISNQSPCTHKILHGHLAQANEFFDISTPWSITITATGTDIPYQCYDDFIAYLDEKNSKKYICSLERGDKDHHRHIQCAAELCWHPEKGMWCIFCILIYIPILSEAL